MDKLLVPIQAIPEETARATRSRCRCAVLVHTHVYTWKRLVLGCSRRNKGCSWTSFDTRKYCRVPTLLVYGEQDWAPAAQRERTGRLIPGVVVTTVGDGGHFLSLDRPAELTDLIVQFGARTSKRW